MIDDDCTEMVMMAPSTMATIPDPAPSALLMAASPRSATSRRMFLVMNARATKMHTRPMAIIRPPLTSPWAPRPLSASLTQVAGNFTAAFNGLLKSLPPLPMTRSVIQVADSER